MRHIDFINKYLMQIEACTAGHTFIVVADQSAADLAIQEAKTVPGYSKADSLPRDANKGTRLVRVFWRRT